MRRLVVAVAALLVGGGGAAHAGGAGPTGRPQYAVAEAQPIHAGVAALHGHMPAPQHCAAALRTGRTALTGPAASHLQPPRYIATKISQVKNQLVNYK